MRTLISVTLLAVVAVGAANVNVERNPVRRHPHENAQMGEQQHVIVKLRQVGASGRAGVRTARDRVNALATRTGLTLDGYRALTTDLHVMHVEPAAAGESITATLARVRADRDVQYAEVDQRRYAHSVPSDTLYSQQWYMLPTSTTTPSAVDAQTAWDTTTGMSSLVIADIDTGVRFDHPDLLSVSQTGGRLLSGYCFKSDTLVANSSQCPGADASDPGDWVSSSDLSQPECSGAQVSYSSWHGTRTAGILGAIANNGAGIAGMTWSPRILPVRALGKCGGSDSDIISGMLWAAGIHVSVSFDRVKHADLSTRA
jgi:serine protease